MAVAQLIRGTTAFIKGALDGMLAGLNADLADAVVSASAPPVFSAAIGEVYPGSPTLSVFFVSSTPARTAQGQKLVACVFKIRCRIPQSGDNTPMNFEMARQVSAEWVLNTFEDDSLVLTPTIHAGSLGTVPAYDADRSDLVDEWPDRAPDGVTVYRGWQMMYQARYAVNTGLHA